MTLKKEMEKAPLRAILRDRHGDEGTGGFGFGGDRKIKGSVQR